MSVSQINFVFRVIRDQEEQIYNICTTGSCVNVLSDYCTEHKTQTIQITNKEYVKKYINQECFGQIFNGPCLKMFVIEAIKQNDLVIVDFFLDVIHSSKIMEDPFLLGLITEKYKHELNTTEH